MSGENTSKVRLMAVWATCQDVRRYALVKWDSLNYAANTPFASESDFDLFLSATLIPRAQAHINAFCRRDFDLDYPDGIPEAVQDVVVSLPSSLWLRFASLACNLPAQLSLEESALPEDACEDSRTRIHALDMSRATFRACEIAPPQTGHNDG